MIRLVLHRGGELRRQPLAPVTSTGSVGAVVRG
jgi:hypothetical protein